MDRQVLANRIQALLDAFRQTEIDTLVELIADESRAALDSWKEPEGQADER